jgi:DNA-binding transcriptional regulator YhcF (GntR family)
MRQGAGTFVRSVERERRAAVQRELAKRLVGDMLGAAGRLGLPRATIVRAFEDAIGVDRS